MFNLFKKKPPGETPQVGQVPAKLKPLRRSTWVPQVRDGDGDLSASKFSGLPWLSGAEGWPRCPNCEKAMQLFVQLNLSQLPSLPEQCPKAGLLQLFYCTSSEPLCEVDCEAYFPGSKSVVARIVKPAENGKAIVSNPVAGAFPPKIITGWQEKDDYPNWEEAEEHGIALTDEESEALAALKVPLVGDKLMGWPAWVQAVEYPDCPRCGTRMHLLFQVDSEDNLPYMFGDLGGRRGDVARALLYLDVRYDGSDHSGGSEEPDLILTDDRDLIVSDNTNPQDPAYMGILSTLLAWHDQDPPDDVERGRNEVVAAAQGNRNPFIDHPEWVRCVFLEPCGIFADGFELGNTSAWTNTVP